MQPDEFESLTVAISEADQRLDKYLAKQFTEVKSRSYFEFLIENERVLVNGKSVKKKTLLKEGDEVEIQFILTPESGLLPEEIPLDIIFEDEHIILVNKAPGMVVHPAVGNWKGTFVNALLYHCKSHPSKDPLRPGIVHRLDKETSGLLLAAKTCDAQQKLIDIFSGRLIEKQYLVICVGNPGSQLIDAPIGRHPVHRKKMTVLPTGREAKSHCEMLAYRENLSIAKIHLLTGRTHQIRVHLEHINCPVLGDSTYGSIQANKKWGVQRQLLHAYELKFTHPITGESLEFKAPLPEDFKSVMEKGKLTPLSF